MADTSIDQLRISIEARAAGARSELSGLSSDVGKLKAGVSGATGSLDALASSLGRIGGQQGAIGTLGEAASAIRRLDGVKVSSTIGNNIGRIADSIGSIGDVGALRDVADGIRALSGKTIDASLGTKLRKVGEGARAISEANVDASRIHQLASALGELANVPKSSISSTVNALRRLPEAASALHGTDFGQVAQDARRLSVALGPLPQKIGAIRSSYAGIGNQAAGAMRRIASATDSVSSRTETLLGKIKGLASTITTLSIVMNASKAVTRAIGSLVDAANKYVEDMNLVNVAMGEYAGQAKDYAEKVYQSVGIAPQDFLRSEGTFTTMARGMGIATDQAATMGQQLTQLAYDLSSFYNISPEEATEKVQAGLAGQIRPLRELGYDLSEAKLKEEALSMGIDKSVESMTQAEKAMLRYHAMLTQVSWAQGDMARTLDSPANMLRVFQSNVSNAARSIGTIFLPVIRSIMPVAIAATKVVATLANMIANLTGGSQLASVDYSGGSAPTLGSDGEDSGDNPIASKYKGVGDAARKAADDVKELRRQVLGFDEINKFSPDSGRSGSGGGRGGSGDGAGVGAGSLPIQTYDFLGDAKGIGDGLYRSLMDMAKRAAKAFDPLLQAASRTVEAIARQFEGLDIAGAFGNGVTAFLNLLSNVVRNAIEIVGPLAVAFNFPETMAYAFDLGAQACLTLSSAVNAIGTAIGNFSREALVPLVAWVGDKLRGAIAVCIDVLSSWQTWFAGNTQALANLGRAAGEGAGFVLSLARAVADPAFDAAAAAFRAVNDGLRLVLGALVNSGAAMAAARLLGAALAVFMVGSGLSAGLDAVSSVFTRMADAICANAERAEQGSRSLSDSLTGGLPSAASRARDSVSNLGNAISNLATVHYERLRQQHGLAVNGLETFNNKAQLVMSRVTGLGNQEELLGRKTQLVAERQGILNRSMETHVSGLNAARDGVSRAASAYQENSSKINFLRQRQAEANRTIAEGKVQMDIARMATAGYTTEQQRNAAAAAGVGTSAVGATAKIAAGTAVKGAATVATGALTAAQTMLNAVVAAFPGMVIAAALSALISNFTNIANAVRDAASGFQHLVQDIPVLSWIGDLVGAIGSLVGWLGDLWGQLTGTSGAQGEVTDTTKEATQVLTEEQQAVKSNVDSINDYARSHDNLKDAIALSGYSVDGWARHLQDIGTTFDEVRQSQDQFVSNTVNGFDRIDSSSQLSLEDVNANLQENIARQRQWSEDIQALMAITGEGMNSNLIQSFEAAGSGKMGAALHELVTNPTGEASQECLRLMDDAGSQMGPAMASALSRDTSATQAASDKARDIIGSLVGGVTAGKSDVESTSQDVDEATVSKFGSHYNEAKDAGRNLSGGFGDGVREASADASRPAGEVSQAVVDALNGGSGYASAVSAGRNLIGGFGDGIRQSKGDAIAVAAGAKGSVIDSLNGGNGYGQASSAGANLMGGYGDGLQSATDRATGIAGSTKDSVIGALNGGAGYHGAWSAGSNMMGGFGDGLQSASGRVAQIGAQAAQSAQQGMGSNYWGAWSAGSNEMGGFVDGLAAGYGNQAWWKGRDAAVSAQDGAGSNYWGAWSAGSNFGYGFGEGIASTDGYVYAQARYIAIRAAIAARSALRIHSPSRVMAEVGGYFGEGFGDGIAATSGMVERSSRGLMAAAVGTTASAKDAGREIGRSVADGMASGIAGGDVRSVVSDALSSTDAAARSALSTRGFAGAMSVPGSHGRMPRMDDDVVTQAITKAVERGMLSVSMAGGQGASNSGDTTVVLRVDGETLAKAVARGNDRLARRGVVQTV
ncbi:hypothetical protein [Olsenella uli]|uniref:hypothetical protein n=1 Tax=Olsenella uli TaxID=133926 RepID=UPI00241ECBE6|nr:hypothetical protein [Olsenella uli]